MHFSVLDFVEGAQTFVSSRFLLSYIMFGMIVNRPIYCVLTAVVRIDTLLTISPKRKIPFWLQ